MKNSKRVSNRKIDLNGIRFQTWSIFVLFASFILISLWLIQYLSLRPYYRSVKVQAVQSIKEDIELATENDEQFIQEITDLTYEKNVCLSIYDHNQHRLSSINALGLGCYIADDAKTDFNPQEYIDRLNINNQKETYDYAMDVRFEDESIIYASKIEVNLGTYYLFISSIVEPIESTVFILQNQFMFTTLFVLFISVIIAFYLSKNYAKPILEITESARTLANGNYDVSFDTRSFTEMNDLAATLNYATTELSKTEELRRDLLANVTHDIKTPLTTIKVYAEMIEDISGDNKEKRKEHLDIIISEANHLDKLVNDIMVLTKVQSGNITLNYTEFDLRLLVREIVDVLHGFAEKEGIRIIIKASKKSMIYADRTLIGQVIYNFLNNALKHVGKDKRIYVRVIGKSDWYRVEIEDHGSGIAENDLPYIWDRYYKINKKYQRDREGSGLGLAISKAYLELHGYPYGADSTVGKGTTFYFETKERQG